MRHWIVPLFCALLVFPVAGAELPAGPRARQATIRAFDALLSFEGATPPESEWQHTAPEDFDPEGEEDLVAYLARQKAAGADFRATRHQGTLLHHALRAGLEYTAQWLLERGADPLQSIGHGDALALAIQYRRWYVVEQLLVMPKVRAHHASDASLSAWEAAAGTDEREVVVRLLNLRLPRPVGTNGEALLELAIRRHWMPLVHALNDDGVRRAQKLSCGMAHSGPLGGWRRAELEKADRGLAEPLLPYLLHYVGDLATLDRLMRMSLRQPWDDVAFASRVIDCTLYAALPTAVQQAILARIGKAALAEALVDDELATRWGNWLLDQPEATARWAIEKAASMPGGVDRLARLVIANKPYFGRAASAQPIPGAGWAVLLDHLGATLLQELNGRIWSRAPDNLHARLLARGYRPSDEELREWVRWKYPKNADLLWPALMAARPDLKQRYPEILFAGALGDQAAECGYVRDEVELRAVDWFVAAGYRPVRPLRIDVQCWRRLTPEVQERLVAQQVLDAPLPPMAGRFVPVTRACKMPATPALRRALADLSDDWVGIQMIDQPGRDDCGLVLHFHPPEERGVGQDNGTFEGDSTHFSPICPESEYSFKLMRVEGEVVTSLPIEGDTIGAMLPVRDAKTGRNYFVAGQMPRARCSPFPLWLLQWDTDATAANAGSPRLAVLPRQDETVQAWLSHCRQMDEMCLAPEHFPAAEVEAEIDSTAAAVDRLFSAERQSFITAVLADDRPRLAQEQTAGVFPHWAVPAMVAVEASNLPVEAKRRRLAWLLRDQRRAAALTGPLTEGGELAGVITWVPREDLKPLLAGMTPYRLETIEKRATELGRHDLACLLATQRFARCRAN